MRSHFHTLACAVGLALAAGCGTGSERTMPETTPARTTNALQRTVERELQAVITETKASGGTILVMSPRGEVLAEAGHVDQAYVAGSTIKPLLLAAAFDAQVVTEADVFDCSHGERGGKVLEDATPLARVGVPELVARSSNRGFAQVFDRLGGARTSRAFERFQFGVPKTLATAPAGDWDGAMTAIGITMNATPRQVTRAYATLANGGDGVVSAETASRMRPLLEGVVTSDHGTGKKAAVAGVRVAGKTGTSAWTGPDGKEQPYASFVGYVPADHPRFVIFVGVESPKGETPWGGEVAAPVFSRVATQALSQ